MLMMDYIKILIFVGTVIVAAIVHAIVMHEKVNDIEGKFNFIDRYTTGLRMNCKGGRFKMRLYKLGKHRLLQGDSTKREALEALMNGREADMVFTDPPYGMRKKSKGDNVNDDELLEFNKKWIPLSFDFLKGNGSWCC